MADRYEDEFSGIPVVLPVETPWGLLSDLGLTLTCSWTSNVALTTKAKRKEDELLLKIKVECSGTPGPSGGLTFTLGGAEIDDAKLNTAFGNRCYIPSDSGFIFQFSATDFYPLWAQASSSTVIAIGLQNLTTVSSVYPTPTVPFSWASADKLEIELRIPIKGWDTHQAYGSGLVKTSTPGLNPGMSNLEGMSGRIASITGATLPTVSSASCAHFYQLPDGAWMAWLCLRINWGSQTVTGLTFQLSGVSFLNDYQALSALWLGSAAPIETFIDAGTFNCSASNAASTAVIIQGTVRLAGKPTFI